MGVGLLYLVELVIVRVILGMETMVKTVKNTALNIVRPSKFR